MEKETIKKTLDARSLRNVLIFRVVAYVVLISVHMVSAIIIFRDCPYEMIGAALPMAMIYTIADGALIYLAASRYVKLLKKAPDFVPAKGYLKDARVKSLKYYFIVNVDLGQRAATGETDAYFSEYSDRTNIHDYLHKKVDVAYDAETRRVLVFPLDTH